MYAYLTGTVAEVNPDGNAVIDVGGIGYNVRLPLAAAGRLSACDKKETVKVFTYTYIREDQMVLYGFLSKEDLELFRMLITVSGVGPKGGLSLLSAASAEDLRFAIITGDVKAITRAPGIGKRTAERMILELKGRIGELPSSLPGVEMPQEEAASFGGPAGEAVEALTALGYSRAEAVHAVKQCADAGDTQQILKSALKYL